MKHEELVTEVMSSLEKRNWSQVEKYLSDNFTFSGAVPKPVSKSEWVNVQRALQSGIPDLKFNLKNVKRQVEVFAVANEGLVIPTPAQIGVKAGSEKSIAVLPFIEQGLPKWGK